MFRSRFYRWLCIPVCVLTGLIELIALQRHPRAQPVSYPDPNDVCHS